MRGSRPLTDTEIERVYNAIKGPYSLRTKCMLTLGLKSGFRINELLSLTVQDVMDGEEVRDQITVKRKNMKKKLESRTVPMHAEAAKSIRAWVQQLRDIEKGDNVKAPLYRSFYKDVSITKRQASRIIHNLFRKCKLPGKVSTHSWRKTFAHKVYKALGENLIDTAAAMGHRSVSSTQSYLQTNRDKINNAVLNI